LKNQELGAIENLVLDSNSGQIAYVALATGSFLELGEKLVAVPWKQLSLTEDNKVYVLALSPKILEKRKGFDADQWPGQIADKLKAIGQGGRDPGRAAPGKAQRGDNKGQAPR
jgi:PRC-barrel domain